MSEIIVKNPIKELVDDATWQTAMIFKNTITEEQLIDFRRYLEDIVLFDIISCGASSVKLLSSKNMVNDNLKVALIASGISRDGTIPNNEKYILKDVFVNRNTCILAKKRVKEVEIEQLGTEYINKVMQMSYDLRIFKDAINAGELVELGLALRERDCGYIEEDQRKTDFARGAQYANWCIENSCFNNCGLEDTLAYDICKYAYDNNICCRHYPLAVKLALMQMADIDLFISINGIENFDNEELLTQTLANINAAKVTDRKLIEPFERRFKDEMRFYVNRRGMNKILRLN